MRSYFFHTFPMLLSLEDREHISSGGTKFVAHGPKCITSASCLILTVLLFSTLISCWFLKNQIECPISGFSQRIRRCETTEHHGGKAGLPGPPGLLRSGWGGRSRSHPHPGAAL